MPALVLAAGRGRRLAPLTLNVPKALLRVGERALIDYAIDACVRKGIGHIVIVAGYLHWVLSEHLARRHDRAILEVKRNAMFDEWDNIYSVHLAEQRLNERSFVLINGDVFFSEEILTKLLDSPGSIVLAIDSTRNLGHEEMKVGTDAQGRVKRIGKQLARSHSSGEYIGVARFDGDGSRAFFKAIRESLRAYGSSQHYEAAVQRLIEKGIEVTSVDIAGEVWIEIDFLTDFEAAQKLVQLVGT